MRMIYVNALKLVTNRINSCQLALSASSEEFAQLYWKLEFAKANLLKFKIQKRIKAEHKVILVDFKNKRRAA